MSTNGTDSTPLFSAQFEQAADACAVISAEVDVLLAVEPVEDIERVHVLVARMAVLVALARRVEAADTVRDTWDHFTVTAEETALIADPLAA